MNKKDITKRKKGEVIHEAKIEEQQLNFNSYKIILITFLLLIVLFTILFSG